MIIQSVSAQPIRTRADRDRLPPRTARRVGIAGFVAGVALPVAVWHRTISLIASDFRLDLRYFLTGWTGFALMACGLLLFVPVLLSIGRSPESRLYPRRRNAYAGWSASMYVLGAALASQVAQIATSPGAH